MIREENEQFIVYCPTRTDWMDVLYKATKNGWQWRGFETEDKWYAMWENHENQSCIFFEEDKRLTYSGKNTYEQTDFFNNIPIISAEEYIKNY